jgi:aldehyde:ferredoxin oxidoreductase
VARAKGVQQFQDSLVTCRFITLSFVEPLCQAVEAATGWQDFGFQEGFDVGRRAVNIARVFNLRRGVGGVELEGPSERYGSAPVDGPNKGITIMPHLERMKQIYYENMGWDSKGTPLPETLRALGLEALVADLPS